MTLNVPRTKLNFLSMRESLILVKVGRARTVGGQEGGVDGSD